MIVCRQIGRTDYDAPGAPDKALGRSASCSQIGDARHYSLKPRPMAVDAFRLCRSSVNNVCKRFESLAARRASERKRLRIPEIRGKRVWSDRRVYSRRSEQRYLGGRIPRGRDWRGHGLWHWWRGRHGSNKGDRHRFSLKPLINHLTFRSVATARSLDAPKAAGLHPISESRPFGSANVPKDRCRFFDIAHGSALECAAALDVLLAKGKVTPDQIRAGKRSLQKIVRMLIGLIKRNSTRDYDKRDEARPE